MPLRPVNREQAWLLPPALDELLPQDTQLATRLLDWTTNPLAAAFFAVYEERDSDAAIFAHWVKMAIAPSQEEGSDPFDIDVVVRWRPLGVVQRIIRQGSEFTIHNPPRRSLEDDLGAAEELEKIVIDKSYCEKLLRELAQYGITKATLFPDIDGLSAFINWAATKGTLL